MATHEVYFILHDEYDPLTYNFTPADVIFCKESDSPKRCDSCRSLCYLRWRLVAAARATTIMVTATSDDTTVNGNCTLREAIIAANEDRAVDACTAGSGVDTLSLPAGTCTLSMAGTSRTRRRRAAWTSLKI